MPARSLTATYASVAARQHGLVTRKQLQQSGASIQQIDRLVQARRLTVMEAGVYLVAGAPRTWHARVLASCLAVDGMSSHRTAGVLHDVGPFRNGAPELSVTRAKHARACHGRVHWTTDLHLIRPVFIDGIPTTPVDRTLLDLGAVCSDQLVERAIDTAIIAGKVTWPQLLDVYRLHSRPGRRGCGTLRRILEARFLDDLEAESHLELDLVRLFEAAGLTGFTTQLEIYDADGFIMRSDVGWEAEKVLVEADSVAFHLNHRRFQTDRTYRNRARADGWTIMEYTALHIRQTPDVVVHEVSAVLAQRRKLL